MEEVTGRLEDWTFNPLWRSYTGFVFDDKKKRFRDGEWIITSSVEPSQIGLQEGDIVTTRNSKYLLGKEQK